jgi:hypothetical protein
MSDVPVGTETKSIQDQIRDQLRDQKKDRTGVFLYGVFTGVVLSYTGLLGFVVGITTGMFVTFQDERLSKDITTHIATGFSYIWNARR